MITFVAIDANTFTLPPERSAITWLARVSCALSVFRLDAVGRSRVGFHTVTKPADAVSVTVMLSTAA